MSGKKARTIARHAKVACLLSGGAYQREFGVLRGARLLSSERCR